MKKLDIERQERELFGLPLFEQAAPEASPTATIAPQTREAVESVKEQQEALFEPAFTPAPKPRSKKAVEAPATFAQSYRAFLKLFGEIGYNRQRHEVWRDFVTMTAIALYNAFAKDQKLEEEYLSIIRKYDKEDQQKHCELLARLVETLEHEPRDVLGTAFMDLELGDHRHGQFFSPPSICDMMARMTYGEQLARLDKPFVTLSEPACGAGGMVLAFVKLMIENKLNPADRLWVECVDVSRTAALMCFIQLTLWNVPGQVIVGNTLTRETQEVWRTPQHFLGFWEARFKAEKIRDAINQTLGPVSEPKTTAADAAGKEPEKAAPYKKLTQSDFGF